MVRLNKQNLKELDALRKTMTMNFDYYLDQEGDNVYRLKRKNVVKANSEWETVPMPDIYKPYFKKKVIL